MTGAIAIIIRKRETVHENTGSSFRRFQMAKRPANLESLSIATPSATSPVHAGLYADL